MSRGNIRFGLRELVEEFHIDQIYVVNLRHRLDRLLRFDTQMREYGLNYKIIEGVNARESWECQKKFQNLITGTNTDCPSMAHIKPESAVVMRRRATVATIGYMESQKKVLLDAIENKYENILVFDDDSVVNAFAEPVDSGFMAQIKDAKIFLAGCSEYAKESDIIYLDVNKQFYHPVPGNTCGSFAVVYNRSIFKEVLELLGECAGTYDNCVLGYIYGKYPDQCFATKNHIVIADVSDSDIRSERDQISHSLEKNWNLASWYRYNEPAIVSIILEDPQVINEVTLLEQSIGKKIFFNFYFMSDIGLRPFHPGSIPMCYDNHNYGGLKAADNFFATWNRENLKRHLESSGLPYSMAAILWRSEKLNMEAIAEALREIAASPDDMGEYKSNIWVRNCGKKPVPDLHSVIIPTIRGPKALLPAIQSVLRQDLQNVEIIIVNDNPTRKLSRREIVTCFMPSAFADNKFIRVINHPKNLNAAAARNTGIMSSNGEYISFLDDDDRYLPQRLSNLQKILMNTPDPNIGAAYCAFYKGRDLKKAIIDPERLRNGTFQTKIITLEYNKYYANTDTLTFRRACLAALNGFDEYFERHQDIELMTRFFISFKMVASNYLGVLLKPDKTAQTYNPTLENLLNLKIKYLSNFKQLLKRHYYKSARDIAMAHANDILKYFKDHTEEMKNRIYLILLKSIIDDVYIK